MTNKEAREVLKEQIDKYGQEYDAEGIEALEIAIKALGERPQGCWIDGGDCKICSVCGDKSPIWLTHYCGNCGAKMSDIM